MMAEEEFSFKRTLITHTRRKIVRRFTRSLPNLRVLSRGWHKKIFIKATNKLRKIHMIWKNKRYKMSQDLKRKKQIELKMLAEYLFKDKKCSYECNTRCLFLIERLNSLEKYLKMTFMRTLNEKYLYGVKVVKFDRKGYKRRTRLLILTNKSLCLNQILKNKLKPKEKIPLDFIKKLEVTSGRDNFLLIKISQEYKHNKGDIILEVPYLIEFVTKFINISGNYKLLNINRLGVNQTLYHDIKGSKSGVIELKEGNSTPSITKDKYKKLIVWG
ncbi:unconventional myosin IC-like [Acyrthosiphon pisum]|uniref:TH1 domain-containing protein n=1 Tax=Acyrthosiphon pisum TaxID=7029 RepID=A0A8R1W8M9_ACYPI|nr:unconventional myosin IC-like [Acyrthosiphon pisum]|eukprot:XP_003245506.1 PREDICTED: myosin-IB-like [Acyrthosiphon pisum]